MMFNGTCVSEFFFDEYSTHYRHLNVMHKDI